MRYLTRERDLLGFGLNWARPQGLSSDQGALETFYRYQVSEAFAVTFDVQLLANPALNPHEDVIGVFGLRTRLNF
jgi:porin